MLKLGPHKSKITTKISTTNTSIPMVGLLQHVCLLLYQLFIIVSVTLIPCTLNVRHGAFACASAVSAFSSSSSSSPATSSSSSISTTSSSSSSAATAAVASATENNYDLHATHLAIDSLMMTAENNNDLSQLTCEPKHLHFDELSVGETANKVVTIFNRHANRSVYLGSISGTVGDFYSSFFEENLVPPMGNTTFKVVFLPRQQAIIQGHLIIHTSFGVLNYEVKGKGVECPYRLSPLVGLKAPLNATLMPEIYMYNPYDTPLQIVEVYSSGGQFQLELPTTDDNLNDVISGNGDTTANIPNIERSQTLWEIPPYCSKPVIRVRFTATHAGNSTAYIRIKVSARKNAALEKAVIVLPIEVEIFKEHGIYANIPFLNFGLSGKSDRPKSVTFRLFNSGNELYDVIKYSVEADDTQQSFSVRNGVTLEMATITNQTYQTMTAIVDWSRISAEQFFRGNILIQTQRRNSNNEATTPTPKSQFQYRIPFVGAIIRGSIQYNESLTRFHQSNTRSSSNSNNIHMSSVVSSSDDKNNAVRDFRIKNNFDVALAITNLTMSPNTLIYFRADNFKSTLLVPGEESTIFQIVQQPAAAHHSVTCSFHLHTNVSVYEIELFSFDGLLKRVLPITGKTTADIITDMTNLNDNDSATSDSASAINFDEKTINFGILPLSTQSQIMLALVNHNPIPINIHNWKGTISSAAHIGITVPGCSKLTMKGLKFCNIVKPGEWIVFQIGVTSNTVGTFDGKFTVQTDYQVIGTPIKFSTDMGILKFTTHMIDTEHCFPGGVCKVNLTAYSTFTRSMHIKSIHVNNFCMDNVSSKMEPQEIDGYDECNATNVSRVNVSDYKNDVNDDIDRLAVQRSPYVIYEDGEKPVIVAQSESFIDQLKLSIPRICDDFCALDVTQMEETIETNRQRILLLKKQLDRFHALSAKFQKLTFHVQTNHIKRYDFNGSIDIVWPKLIKTPIEFEISQVGNELIKNIDIFNPFDAPLQIHYYLNDGKQFSVFDIVQQLPFNIIDISTNKQINEDHVFSLGTVGNHLNSDIVVIPAKTYHRISIKFMSENPGNYGTIFWIRNNVTVLEATWITAKSVVPQFKFGNRKPGSKTPLLFELTDKHLRDCNHPNINMRSVIAKRTFTAKNNGEVPIYMYGLRIDDLPCEGYGYRILDCMPFELPPNGSKKIEISFTPDFTLAMVKKTLYLETTLNYSVNYTLHSIIAPLSLGLCSKALARPEWESMMKNVTAVVLAVSFVCVLFAAYLDSMKVLKVHVENISKAKGSLQPALDLRQIGLKTLFSDDVNKGSGTPTFNTVTSFNSTTGTANSSTKQTPSTAFSCNAKTIGSIYKKKTTEKKRTSCSSSSVSTEIITPKKSYITEIAKKFTPRKSETKPKPEHSREKCLSPPLSPPFKQQTTTTNNSKKEKRPKDEISNGNYEEEETSSTTTESSSHSDDKSPNEKSKFKNSTQSSKDLAATLPPIKDKMKNIVKKSKSLPLPYESRRMLPCHYDVPLSPIMDKKHGELNDNQHDSFELLNCIFNNDEDDDDDGMNLSTPPSKMSSMKLLGKTPGRERIKTNENNKTKPYRKTSDTDGPTLKKSTFISAFEFASPCAGHPLLDLVEKSSLYEQNDNGKYKLGYSASSSSSSSAVSLSSVVKIPTTNKTKCKNEKNKQSTTKLKHEAKTKERKNAKKHTSNNGNVADDGIFSCKSSFEYQTSDRKVSSPGPSDLGPIGTRKSPIQNWESIHSIQNPIPKNSSNSLNTLEGRSNSFFTGIYSQTSSYQRNNNVLNDVLNQHQLNSSEQLQQLRQQQQQQQQNADLLRYLNGMYGGNTNLEQHKPNLWHPNVLYTQQTKISLQRQQQQQQHQQQFAQQRLQSVYSSAPNSLWNSSTLFDSTSSTSSAYWPSNPPAVSSSHEIRPPPGFGHTTARDPRTLVAQNEVLLRNYEQLVLQKQLQVQHQLQEQQQNQASQSDSQYDRLLNSLTPSDNWNSIWSSDTSWNSQSGEQNKKTK